MEGVSDVAAKFSATGKAFEMEYITLHDLQISYKQQLFTLLP